MPPNASVASVGLLDDRAGSAGGHEGTAVVGVRGPVVVRHGIDDDIGDLGSTGTVEEDERPVAVGDGEGREAAPEGIDVEGRHDADATPPSTVGATGSVASFVAASTTAG